MYRFFIIIICCIFPLTSWANDIKPANIIMLDSKEGTELYKKNINANNIKLFQNYVTQDTTQFCGIASSVIVLNALGVERLVDSRFYPNKYTTQNNIWQKTSDIVSMKKVNRQGITLEELESILASFSGLKTQILHADKINFIDFQNKLKEMQDNKGFIIAQFRMEYLYDKKGGHFSPIAAYDQETGYILVLDVQRYYTAPFWVKDEIMWQAMNTYDEDGQKYRGFVFVTN
jgi:hypothetical protein